MPEDGDDRTRDRKIEHIRIIQEDHDVERGRAHFDAFHLTHRAVPELSLSEVDTSISFLERRLSFPMLISSMTGGDHDLIRDVNRNLAIAAQSAGVAMGVGSMRVMFTHAEARASFDLRRHAPDIPLLANMGAVQLNYGFGIEQAREMVDLLEADALILHLNPLQEAIQPEGDTNFLGLIDQIASLADALPVPIIAKEVGSGISPDDARLLLSAGVQMFDVAGSGGTSWSRIEHHRTEDGGDLGLVFQDWGIPTPIALQQLAALENSKLSLIASGGIRNGIDMVKSLILGARLAGMARPFLEPAMQSPDAVVQVLTRIQREFRTAQFLLGQGRAEDLIGQTSLFI